MYKKIIYVLIAIVLFFAIFLLCYDFQCNKISPVGVNLIASFFAGILLTLTLFIVNEYLFKLNLTGEWEVTEKINEPSTNPYLGYNVHYIFHILQKGSEIVGYGEKVSQFENNDQKVVFERVNRVRVELAGYIQKGYVSDSVVYFLIHEFGRQRETSSTYFLRICNKNLIAGSFTSTAADAKGSVELKRK